MKMVRPVTVVTVALLMLWASGCGAPATPTQQPTAPPGQVAPGPTVAEAVEPDEAAGQEVAATEPAEVEALPTMAEIEPTEVAGAASEDDTGMALQSMEDLDSYRQQVTMVSEVAGKETSQVDILQEFVREIPASRSVMTIAEGDEPPNTVETVQIGDTVYTKSGDTWFAATREGSEDLAEQYLAWANPRELMGSGDCSLVGTEQVAGLQAKHYSCAQELLAASQAAARGLASSAITEGTVETWVSTQYEIAIKTAVQWKGVDADGNDVTFSYQATVSDINAPITIEPPEGTEAPGLPDDVPLIEGATNVEMSGQPPMLIVSFEVALPAVDVISFYNEEMAAQGWTGQVSPIPGMASFEKDGRTAMVTAGESGGTTTATIMIGVQ